MRSLAVEQGPHSIFGMASTKFRCDSHTTSVSAMSPRANPSNGGVAAFVRDDAEISNGVPPLPL